MTSRLKNRPGLRLDLNMKPPNLPPVDLLKPSSSTGTAQTSSTTATNNWREDLARMVSKNKSMTDISNTSLDPALSLPSNGNGNSGVSDSEEEDLKSEDVENIQKLGEGAAGTVWKVKHKPTGRIMAKKTITVDPDPQLQRQILRELSFLRTCGSPHIVAFYGAFLDDGDTTIAICMEYCEGGSLEDIYKRAKSMEAVIGETILAKLAEAVCMGLIHLHSHNVIHRDIKPSNILMTRQGEFKLCDLGVSGELINSMAQTFTGTQYYMAPERIKGGTYSVRSDIWSLGLSIIEVAQNQPALPPPDNPNLSIFELLDFIVHQPMPNLGADRSPECRDFIAKCLIKEPSERPGPEIMLQHPFIKNWAHLTDDITPWLKQVWGWS
ncbi:kinase-like domain-containing protein [Absidia repens]|uniref:Kinase-like domain-containing protein n=1 Tax=Absidia repens TaxID=90262 RepID=A0A1X2I1W4_9FUNG|nr:kinase-like domain-containing protein [Absidia repens]